MASLAGKTLLSTYTSLLKLEGDTQTLVGGGGTAIQIKTGDNEVTPLYLNTDRLGIGTSTPACDLHIGGTNPQIRIGDDGAEDTSLCFMGNAQDFYIALDDTTDDLTIGTGTTIGSNVKMVVENGGNVGIGTAAPDFSLHVLHATNNSIVLIESGDGTASLYLQDSASGGNNSVGVSAVGNDFRIMASSGGTERLRVKGDSGNVGIGHTSPTFPLHVVGEGPTDYIAMFDNSSATQDSHGIVIRAGDIDHADSATHYILFEESDGDDVGQLDSDSGNLALSDTSDYRLKENINLITGGLAKVNALKPSTFNYKKYPNKVHDGFIAHEVVDAGIGYAVRGDKDAVKDDGSVNPQLLAITNLIPQIVSAIQELSAEITILKNG